MVYSTCFLFMILTTTAAHRLLKDNKLKQYNSDYCFENVILLQAQEELANYFTRYLSILEQNRSAKIDR